MDLTSPEARERIAKAVCREKCAFYGELACWQVDGPWPAPECDEPGCHAIADAALAEVAAMLKEDGDAH